MQLIRHMQNTAHPATRMLRQTHTGDVLSALQCGALGALNENMLVEGYVSDACPLMEKKRNVDPRSNCGFFLKKIK